MRRKAIMGVLVLFLILIMLSITCFIAQIGLAGYVVYTLTGITTLIIISLIIKTKLNKVIEVEKDRTKREKGYKIFVYILILGIVIYISVVNLIVFPTTYTLNVGKESNGTIEPLYPKERITSVLTEYENKEEIEYRNVNKFPVYFKLNLKEGEKFNNLQVDMRFKDTLPEGSILWLGAKDIEEWHFDYKPLYNPLFKQLKKIKFLEDGEYRLYMVDENLKFNKLQDFLSNIPQNSVIYTPDYNIPNEEAKVTEYINSYTEINKTIRSSLELYVYVKGKNLNLEVNKEDLNWYKGPDVLDIQIINSENELIKEIKILDDGITDSERKKGEKQSAIINLEGIDDGVYILKLLNNEDMYITNVKVNQKKIVFDGLFVISPTTLFVNLSKNSRVEFSTYHEASFQDISIVGSEEKKIVEVNSLDKKSTTLKEGEYIIDIPKGDVTIKSDGLLSFSKENFFIPFKYTVLTKQEDLLGRPLNQVDFILIKKEDILEPSSQDWLEKGVSFNKNEWISENNKVLFAIGLDAPNQVGKLSIDYIKITKK